MLFSSFANNQEKNEPIVVVPNIPKVQDLTIGKRTNFPNRIVLLLIFFIASILTGCFQGGNLSIDDDDYGLSDYSRKRKSQFSQRVTTSGFVLSSSMEYNDLIYISDEMKETEVWIRLGYNAKYKFLGANTFKLGEGGWQKPGMASCVVKSNGINYECFSGSIVIGRKGLWGVTGNIANASARIKGERDAENIKQINLQYEGGLLKWRIGFKLPDMP